MPNSYVGWTTDTHAGKACQNGKLPAGRLIIARSRRHLAQNNMRTHTAGYLVVGSNWTLAETGFVVTLDSCYLGKWDGRLDDPKKLPPGTSKPVIVRNMRV